VRGAVRQVAARQDTAHDDGPLHIEVPRDHHGSFEPVPIPNREHRFTDLIATIKA